MVSSTSGRSTAGLISGVTPSLILRCEAAYAAEPRRACPRPDRGAHRVAVAPPIPLTVASFCLAFAYRIGISSPVVLWLDQRIRYRRYAAGQRSAEAGVTIVIGATVSMGPLVNPEDDRAWVARRRVLRTSGLSSALAGRGAHCRTAFATVASSHRRNDRVDFRARHSPTRRIRRLARFWPRHSPPTRAPRIAPATARSPFRDLLRWPGRVRCRRRSVCAVAPFSR